jgi:hypothetical protein
MLFDEISCNQCTGTLGTCMAMNQYGDSLDNGLMYYIQYFGFLHQYQETVTFA